MAKNILMLFLLELVSIEVHKLFSIKLVCSFTPFEIDRSVVESFKERWETCTLSRVYPSLAIGKEAHLHVFNNGRVDIKVSKRCAWEMKKH